jgi:subtilisin family serine protease
MNQAPTGRRRPFSNSQEQVGAQRVFGITSDFSTEIQCFTFSSFAGFPNNQCYAVRQGTSMAAAHVAAVAALILATHPAIWKTSTVVANVVLRLKSGTTVPTGNATPPDPLRQGVAICTR